MPILYLLVLVLVLVLSWALNQFGQKSNTIPYSRLVELFRQEQVSQFLVEGNHYPGAANPLQREKQHHLRPG